MPRWLLMASLLVDIGSLVAQNPGPGQLVGHRLGYDGRRDRILVYQGLEVTGPERRYRSTLWSLSGNQWVVVDSGGPPGRDDPQLGFDPRRDVLILHGGRRLGATRDEVTVLTDTWVHDGRGWRQVDSAGPPPRVHPGMTYDEGRGVLVLFGGFGADESLRSDTWEWDGTRWTRRGDGPPGRWVNGLGYDRSLGAVVLHAVAIDAVDRDSGFGPSELWRWDGTVWARVGDGPRISPQFPVVGTAGGLAIFDGWARREGRRVAETWRWEREAWRRVEGPAPPPRRGTAMVYDSRRRTVILIGGETEAGVVADRWELRSDGWHRLD